MLLGECLIGSNDLVEVSVHELICNVNIIEGVPLRWRYYIPNRNNILMIHMPQQLDLSQRPLRIDPVVECIRNLLHRNVLVRLRIQSRAISFAISHD